MTKPEGPTEHLTDYRYWRDNYLTSIEVGKEMLAERDATITRLEAEVEHPSWLYSSNPTTWPEWAQTWQADYLTATTALAAAEAEVATLREALVEIDTYLANDPAVWRIVNVAKAGEVLCDVLGAELIAAINASVQANLCAKCGNALATPTATAREGGEG